MGADAGVGPHYSRGEDSAWGLEASQFCLRARTIEAHRLWHRQGHPKRHNQHRARKPGRHDELYLARGLDGCIYRHQAMHEGTTLHYTPTRTYLKLGFFCSWGGRAISGHWVVYFIKWSMGRVLSLRSRI